MNRMLALFFARNKEYYRDKSSLAWSFIIPPIIIAVISLAFSKGEQSLFKVGLLQTDTNISSLQLPPILEKHDYLDIISYTDKDKALTRLTHHQIDILIDTKNHAYWINDLSQRGKVLDQLLNQNSDALKKNSVTGNRIRYIDWVVPGILAMNLMFSSLFGVGYVVVRYRKNGVLKRLQATPVRPIEFLTAQVLSRLLIMLVVSIFIYISSDFFLDLVMLGSFLNLFIVALFGNIALISLGLIVASRMTSEEFANGLLNFLSFPMLLLSEVWFSLDGSPTWMSSLSQIFPMTHMVQAARAIMLEGATLLEIAHHLWVLGGMSLIFVTLAAFLFKWTGD